MQKIAILGVKVSNITKNETIEISRGFLFDGGQHIITSPNPEMAVLALKDAEFASVFDKADLCLPDGIGLILASKFFGTPLKERITGSDFIFDLLNLSEKEGKSVYLLGASEGVAEKASLKLKEKYPNLKIVGTESGGDAADLDNQNTLNKINSARPDILFVAFGQVKQEKWIAKNLPKLPSVKIAIGIGGAFDFIAGTAKRAPKIIRKIGLEWLWRLILEPWRAKRIWNATMVFGWKCALRKLNF
jgi:N-acetylglucosaminyldiphosphoundecaprenol N-acetyl-beta-D-mannosaminyltransferase